MTNKLTVSQKQDLALTVARPLDSNPAAVYLAALAPTGRRSQRQALDVLASLLTNERVTDCLALDWSKVRYQHAAALRAKLAEVYKPATCNRMLCALRGVLKNAWKLGLMTAEQYHRAASVPSVRGTTVPAGRELTSGELAALLQSCEADPTPAGVRDAAMIGLLYIGGLRRSELVSLDVSDYDPNAGKLLVRHAKGRKERFVFVNSGAGRALADWLAVRGPEPGALFVAVIKGGRLVYRRLNSQTVFDMLARRGEAAGVAAFSPHDLRRTFVSDLLEGGADISTVSKMAGHASVTTTARYDRRGEEAARQASGLLHLPYHGKKKDG